MTAALIPDTIDFSTDASLAAAPAPSTRIAPTPVSQPTLVSQEVYRRRRLVVVALVAGLLLGLASFGRQADATPTAQAQAAEAIVVVVQPGDTLWSIAESLVPNSDPRPIVAALSDLSGGAGLQPGQLLTVPGDLVG